MSSHQYISVRIDDEEYGLDVMCIREIKGWTPTTPLPESPLYMRGVIDLRGTIVPILDLRARFGAGQTTAGPRHVVVVVAVSTHVVGILADAVADIITVEESAVQPVPELEHRAEAGLLSGLVTVEGRMVALLDLDRVFNFDVAVLTAAA